MSIVLFIVSLAGKTFLGSIAFFGAVLWVQWRDMKDMSTLAKLRELKKQIHVYLYGVGIATFIITLISPVLIPAVGGVVLTLFALQWLIQSYIDEKANLIT